MFLLSSIGSPLCLYSVKAHAHMHVPISGVLRYTIVFFTGIAAGILSFTLPETAGREMLESVEEAEEFYKSGNKKKIELKLVTAMRDRRVINPYQTDISC